MLDMEGKYLAVIIIHHYVMSFFIFLFLSAISFVPKLGLLQQ